jgi:hypothetical protein
MCYNELMPGVVACMTRILTNFVRSPVNVRVERTRVGVEAPLR